MKSHMGGLRRKFMANHLITTEQGSARKKDVAREENVIEWLTLY